MLTLLNRRNNIFLKYILIYYTNIMNCENVSILKLLFVVFSAIQIINGTLFYIYFIWNAIFNICMLYYKYETITKLNKPMEFNNKFQFFFFLYYNLF